MHCTALLPGECVGHTHAAMCLVYVELTTAQLYAEDKSEMVLCFSEKHGQVFMHEVPLDSLDDIRAE